MTADRARGALAVLQDADGKFICEVPCGYIVEQTASAHKPRRIQAQRRRRAMLRRRVALTVALLTVADSANKRISVAEGFLAVDGILDIMLNVTADLVVYPKVITARVMKELPFMATENIMMQAVKKGGDRQQLHEKLRVHSQAAARVVKEEGGENDLVDRVAGDPSFGLTKEEILSEMQPSAFVGRAPQQVDEFLDGLVRPILEENKDLLGETADLKV